MTTRSLVTRFFHISRCENNELLIKILYLVFHIIFNRNSDLTEQCLVLKEEKVNLIKDKEDGQRQIKELRQTSQSMERKIETLINELTR